MCRDEVSLFQSHVALAEDVAVRVGDMEHQLLYVISLNARVVDGSNKVPICHTNLLWHSPSAFGLGIASEVSLHYVVGGKNAWKGAPMSSGK